MTIEEKIQAKLKEWREYHTESGKYMIVREVKASEPIHMLTGNELMTYSKWRAKADLALNEVHALQARAYPDRITWSLEQLAAERKELLKKLRFAEDYLKEHKK